MTTYSTNFIIGMALLATNNIVGWGGILIGAYLAKKTCKKAYAAIGAAIYAVSWGMLILGVALAGPDGVRIIKNLFLKHRLETTIVCSILFITALLLLLKREGKCSKNSIPG